MRSVVKRTLSLMLTVVLLITTCVPTWAYSGTNNAGVTDETISNGYSDNPNAYEIYPMPQSVVYEGDENPTSFEVSETINVVYGNTVDAATKEFVKRVLASYDKTYIEGVSVDTSKTNILIGVKGQEDMVNTYFDTNVQIQNETLYDEIDAYAISVKDNVVAILGQDVDAAFYGVASLQMMFSSFAGTKLLNAQIEDYAVMKHRGFIEGFYGSWTDEGRASLMRMGQDFKLNTYVYASKTDPYHTSKCAELYPQDQLDKIAELVKVGEETKCRYAWSMHFSGFFSGLDMNNQMAYETKYAKLIAKFKQLYDVGIRHFDILNDDFGAGTNADVIKVLNRINQEFIIPNGCDEICYCPQGYNEAWAGNYTELTELSALDDNINIYWTGRDVNAPITQSTINVVLEKSGQTPVTWINYPCNEHAASGVFLGECTYYIEDNVQNSGGIIANGSQWAEINKNGMAQMGCLAWNNKNYSSYAVELWENIFKYFQPEVYDAYLTIARNISNAPNSGRVGNAFPESEYIKEDLEHILAKAEAQEAIADEAETQNLVNEFVVIQKAVAEFKQDCDNEQLLFELDPWLDSLNDLAVAGEQVIKAYNLAKEDRISESWGALAKAIRAYTTQGTHMATYTQSSTYQKPALAGSKRLEPFAKKMINAVKVQLASVMNPVPSQTFIGQFGGVVNTESAESAKLFDKDLSTVASYNVVQKEGDYYGVDFGMATTINNIDIVQGNSDTDHDIFHYSVLEYSVDGKDWTTLQSYENEHNISVSGISVEARYVRLRLTKVGYGTKNDYWSHIREFEINKYACGESGIYTNIEGLDATFTSADTVYGITGLSEVLLEQDAYVGVKLPDLYDVKNVKVITENQTEDVQLEYSQDGSAWNTFTGSEDKVNARYVRIHNNGNAAVRVKIKLFEVEVIQSGFTPKLLETSYTQLKEGEWENVFDGDHSTYVWTNQAQEEGAYVTFDLGNTKPLYDVSVVCADGKPRIYNAQLQVSTDNKTWNSIAEAVNSDISSSTGLSLTDGKWILTGNNQGEDARYVRIYFTAEGVDNPFLRINEVEFNKTVSTENARVTTNLSGEVGKMFDNDLATMYLSETPSNGDAFIEYKITSKAALSKLSVLQDSENISNAVVTAKVYNNGTIEEQNLGVLDEAATVFELDGTKVVKSIKIVWPNDTTPAIYEVYTVGSDLKTLVNVQAVDKQKLQSVITEANGKDEDSYTTESMNVLKAALVKANAVNTNTSSTSLEIVSAMYELRGAIDALVEEGNPEPDKDPVAPATPEDLTVKEGVTVTFTGTSREDGITDPSIMITGDETGRFATDYVQKGDKNVGRTSNFVIDLGSKKIMTGGKLMYHNLAYSTATKVEVSTDNATWSTVKEITRDSAGAAYPVDQYTLAKAVYAQYVRITFSGMNTSAGADYVIVKSARIMGGEDTTPPEPDVEVTSITLDKKSASLVVDETEKLTATVNPSNATDATVTWTSDKPAVATVDANGTVKAVGVGTATITAKAGTKSATCTVTVKAKIVEVASVTLDKKTATLVVDETEKLTATVNPSNATDAKVIWASDKAAVATVDANGTVKAVGVGTATITAKAGTKSATCTVTVKAKIVEVASVTLDKKTATLVVDETEKLTATVNPGNATEATVTWTSDKPEVATVDANGIIKAIGVGTTTITAKAGMKSATCTVTVTAKPPVHPENGWDAVGSKWKYYQNNIAAKSKWILDNGSWYYMGIDEFMTTKWQKVGGKWYYLGTNGKMVTKWKQIDKVWYYFDKSGAMATGWKQIGRVWYYFNKSGAMLTNWRQINKAWYYFEQSGAMTTGWNKIGGAWYYMNASGKMQTGWQKVSGKWYYMNTSGKMQTGWQKVSGKWYYMNTSGKMLTGWIRVKGKSYFMNQSGVWTGQVR